MISPYLREFEEALQSWDDQRFITRDELRAVATFTMYLVNLLDDKEVVYVGHSLRIRSPMCLLVVRGVLAGTQHVVFTSGRTPVACMRIFLRKLEEGLLEWSLDKFA